MKKFKWLMVFTLFISYSCYAQTLRILAAADTFRKKMPQEKLYLHTDKSYYTLNDTLWFKSYLLNADFLDASTRSGLLYVELCTDSGQVIKRQLLQLKSGICWGSIALDDVSCKEGTYTLRAYTNWMRNFGEACFFTKKIPLYNPVSRHWLVKSKYDLNKGKILAHMALTNINGEPIGLRELELKVFNGKKNIYQGKADTHLDGTLDVNFALPERPGQLLLQVKDLRTAEGNQKLQIPLSIQRPALTDLQFMPEGGNLVAGLNLRVAFKAIGEDGRSTEVTGNIYNSRQQQVASFKSTHLGMGSFYFTPQAGETYTAKITQPDSVFKTYPLPEVKTTGTALQVSELLGQDSLNIKLSVTNEGQNRAVYYLTGQSHNLVCYAAKVIFKKANVYFKIPKSAFPAGVARFSLLNEQLQPLNERMAYIDHHDNLNISIAASKSDYKIYDSVALKIEVKDDKGTPVQGSFSLSVTDDGQVRADSTNSILTNMLLTSDLKGEIEDPSYYFNKNVHAARDLDNLLLTQGWTGYDWKLIFSPKIPLPAFAAESGYAIHGRVTNAFNKPLINTGVSLFSKKPLLIMDTLTNTEGRFTFKNITPVDTAMFFIQAINKGGKSFNVGVMIDEFIPPEYIPAATMAIPWYVNTDTSQLKYAKTNIAKNQVLSNLTNSGKILKEVNIKAKRIIKDSYNLNGPGESDQVIDKDELEQAGKTTLGDLMKQKIKGFTIGEFPLWITPPPYRALVRLPFSDPRRKKSHLIVNKQLRLIIDGYDVDYMYQVQDPNSKTERFLFIQSYLDYYTAEDIKGIEVMYSNKYNSIYNTKILPGNDKLTLVNIYSDIAYVEVTTRSGKGPFVKATPGTYLYKPLPVSLPKQFYRPRYTAKPKNTNADFRSTIHWEPNIVTNTDGTAVVSFYAAGHPENYTINLEGSNLNGNVGTVQKKITIK